MYFDWLADPAAWAGLATLVTLELVLGIDNLMFISILAAKLPHHQRDRARVIGLSLALLMRLLLLASIAWIVTLKEPVFSVSGHPISIRDIILIVGGVFLIFKAISEISERLEGHGANHGGNSVKGVFWQVILQIVILDAVFSLDSIITAIGISQHLSIMVTAVVIAMGVMMLLSKFLLSFVTKHPTVVMLCLCFLMLIGFSLIIEGFGIHVPKEYIYAMIAFAIVIEGLNLTTRRNREKMVRSGDLRERTADAVLSLLGGKRGDISLGDTADVIAGEASQHFSNEEKDMIEGVLTLADRPVKSIMTPSTEIDWLDFDGSPDELKAKVMTLENSRVPVGRGSLDNFIGVVTRADLMRDLVVSGKIDTAMELGQPLSVHESMSSLKLMERLRAARPQVAMVVDEHGAIQGMITPTDILEAIAGQFSDAEDEVKTIETISDKEWMMRGWTPIGEVGEMIGVDLTDADDQYAYSTLAGYILSHQGEIPEKGHTIDIGELRFEIMEMDARAVERVRVAFL